MNLKLLRGVTSKNATSILTGVSIFGLISTAVLAVQATPKALDIINAEKKALGVDEIPTMDMVKMTWQCYIPAIAVGGLTIASMIWSNSLGLNRTAALASAYSLSDSKLRKIQDKFIDRLGPKKVKEVQDEIAKEKLVANPISDDTIIEYTGKGETLCYDALSGRYFKSDIEAIRSVINKLSRDLMSEDFITLNQIYNELGLKGTKMGENIGWHVDDGLIDPYFDAALTENGLPCLVLDFDTNPRYFYC